VSHHTNQSIMDRINSSSQLKDNFAQLTEQLTLDMRAQFETTFLVSLPSADSATVYVFQYDLVYASDPTISEYVDGATTIVNSALGLDYPQTALAAISVVQTVVDGILGSGKIQATQQSDSLHVTETNIQNPLIQKNSVAACLSIVNTCTAKQWDMKDDFYLAYYIFAVWPVTDAELARFQYEKRG
jgi:hypothetical protein